jgi:archaellum component FlaC
MENKSKLKELHKEYERLRRLYNYYLVSQQVAKSSTGWYDPYETETLSDLKAEVGEYREMLHFISRDLKKIKLEIKNTNRNFDLEINKKGLEKL